MPPLFNSSHVICQLRMLLVKTVSLVLWRHSVLWLLRVFIYRSFSELLYSPLYKDFVLDILVHTCYCHPLILFILFIILISKTFLIYPPLSHFVQHLDMHSWQGGGWTFVHLVNWSELVSLCGNFLLIFRHFNLRREPKIISVIPKNTLYAIYVLLSELYTFHNISESVILCLFYFFFPPVSCSSVSLLLVPDRYCDVPSQQQLPLLELSPQPPSGISCQRSLCLSIDGRPPPVSLHQSKSLDKFKV